MKDQLTTSHAGLRIFEKVMNARTDQDFSDAVKKMGLYVSAGKIEREEEANLELLIARQAVLHMMANEGARSRKKRSDLSTELAKGYVSWYELSQAIVGVSAKVVTVTEQDRSSYASEFSEIEVFKYEPDYIKARAFEELQGYLPTDIDAALREHYDYLRSQDCYASMMNGTNRKEEATIFSRILQLFYPEGKREYIGRR